MSHTPAPWILHKPSTGIDNNWHVTDQGDTFVAHVYGFAHSVDKQSYINARLIAAAPELLEALQSIMSGVAGCEREPHWESARAAIFKATGK